METYSNGQDPCTVTSVNDVGTFDLEDVTGMPEEQIVIKDDVPSLTSEIGKTTSSAGLTNLLKTEGILEKKMNLWNVPGKMSKTTLNKQSLMNTDSSLENHVENSAKVEKNLTNGMSSKKRSASKKAVYVQKWLSSKLFSDSCKDQELVANTTEKVKETMTLRNRVNKMSNQCGSKKVFVHRLLKPKLAVVGSGKNITYVENECKQRVVNLKLSSDSLGNQESYRNTSEKVKKIINLKNCVDKKSNQCGLKKVFGQRLLKPKLSLDEDEINVIDVENDCEQRILNTKLSVDVREDDLMFIKPAESTKKSSTKKQFKSFCNLCRTGVPNLKAHFLNFHEGERISCYRCPAVFYGTENYRRHVLSHTGGPGKYPCLYRGCYCSYQHPASLLKHQKLSHKLGGSNFSSEIIEDTKALIKSLKSMSKSEKMRRQEVEPRDSEDVEPLKCGEVELRDSEEIAPLKSEEVVPLKSENIVPLKSEEIVPLKSEEIVPLNSEEIVPLNSEEIELQVSEEIELHECEEMEPQGREEMKMQVDDTVPRHMCGGCDAVFKSRKEMTNHVIAAHLIPF